MARSGSTVAEYLPRHHKVEGSSPAIAAATWKEEMEKVLKFIYSFCL